MFLLTETKSPALFLSSTHPERATSPSSFSVIQQTGYKLLLFSYQPVLTSLISGLKPVTCTYQNKALSSHLPFFFFFLTGSLQNSCRSIQAEEAKSGAGLLHLAARGVLLWSPRRRRYNLFYKSTKNDKHLVQIIFSLLFCSHTGALKSYLRELPEPLMTFGLYDEWTQASKWGDTHTHTQRDRRDSLNIL